jgi:hypothetical protein
MHMQEFYSTSFLTYIHSPISLFLFNLGAISGGRQLELFFVLHDLGFAGGTYKVVRGWCPGLERCRGGRP